MRQFLLSKIELILFTFACLLFFVSALGFQKLIIVMLGSANAISLIGVQLLLREIKIPKSFYLFLAGLAALFAHLMIFKGSEFFFWLFLSGGLYWFAIHNAKKTINKYFAYGLFFTTFIMILLFIFFSILGKSFVNTDALFTPPTMLLGHSNIGLLCVIVLLTLLENPFKFNKYFQLLLIIITGVFLFLARSRTALVSLIGTLIYSYSKKEGSGRKLTTAIVILATIFFLYSAYLKPTLTSRPYFFEALFILFSNPLGIGMANLAKFGGSSNLTHNIILEFMVGAGVFSLPFIAWFGKTVYDTLVNKREDNLYRAIFLAITISFMFDVTYILIPFVWLWFLALGMLDTGIKRSNINL